MNISSSNSLQIMLANRDWLLADGATGTNLFNMGLSSGDAPELWNKTAPTKIKALYQSSVDAGSDPVQTVDGHVDERGCGCVVDQCQQASSVGRWCNLIV